MANSGEFCSVGVKTGQELGQNTDKIMVYRNFISQFRLEFEGNTGNVFFLNIGIWDHVRYCFDMGFMGQLLMPSCLGSARMV